MDKINGTRVVMGGGTKDFKVNFLAIELGAKSFDNGSKIRLYMSNISKWGYKKSRGL